MIPSTLHKHETEMILRLRKVCEAHDPGITRHLDNVAHFSAELARLAGLAPEQVGHIALAAPLHDLGKIGLRRTLLEKPGILDPNEMMIVQSHTQIGHDLLAGSPWPIMQCAARIAHSHHENWDGTGYPNGLRGEEIPLEARIVAVADVYDALLADRPYKPAWPEDRVIAELTRLRNVKYEPALIDLFLAHLPQIRSKAA
ncbi:MAG: HD domain-containing phosphohydrolase [Opitutaceae bacterium]